jgi:hypothetical protein
MQTPIVFLIFNREDATKRAFKAIQKAKPAKLLIVADGPRSSIPQESAQCNRVREIVELVDWPCEVVKNYSDINLGCKKRVSSGLDWAFNLVEEAIILEDDCIPHPTFFSFCQTMLEKYRNDERVMMVSGTNILSEWKSQTQSYHFSYYGSIWGWATWRRSWKHYDVEMTAWEDVTVKRQFKNFFCDPKQYEERRRLFDLVSQGGIDTWDIQWGFSRFSQSGMSVVPSVNLISNIGFSNEATHTTSLFSEMSELPTSELKFPLRHPNTTIVDREYDDCFYRKHCKRGLIPSALNKVKLLIKKST